MYENPFSSSTTLDSRNLGVLNKTERRVMVRVYWVYTHPVPHLSVSSLNQLEVGCQADGTRHPRGMIGTTQINNQKLQEEAPMFSKNQISFSPKTPLTHLVAANNNVVMAMANQTLTRKESVDSLLCPSHCLLQ